MNSVWSLGMLFYPFKNALPVEYSKTVQKRTLSLIYGHLVCYFTPLRMFCLFITPRQYDKGPSVYGPLVCYFPP